MSFTITTIYRADVNGKGKVTAKGHGRQRTVNYDHDASVVVNHASALGTLLNVLATPEQQAKVKHPSGGQRVTVDQSSGHARWTIEV